MGKTLAELVGSYNNLDEPIPLANKQSTILGVCITFMILSWVCGFLRLWTRIYVIKAPWWDDLFVAISMVLATVGDTMICLGGAKFGLGKHFLELGGPQAMSHYLLGFYIANGSYIVSTAIIKMALLLQYLRIFDRGTLLHRFTFAMLIVVGLWGLSYGIIAWYPCNPPSGNWTLNTTAKCWGFASQDPGIFRMTFESHTSLNMIFDLVVLSIPIPLYFRNGVQTKMRRGLVGLLMIGAVASSLSMWRLATIVEHQAATVPTFDPSWYGCKSILLATVELNVAVVCASVPVFWPVLQSAGFQIFITKEVEIKTEARLGSSDGAEEGLELHESGAMPAGLSRGAETAVIMKSAASLHSDDGSEVSLRNVSSNQSNWDRPPEYYNDKYIRSHVDPLRQPSRTQPGMEVNISADPAPRS